MKDMVAKRKSAGLTDPAYRHTPGYVEAEHFLSEAESLYLYIIPNTSRSVYVAGALGGKMRERLKKRNGAERVQGLHGCRLISMADADSGEPRLFLAAVLENVNPGGSLAALNADIEAAELRVVSRYCELLEETKTESDFLAPLIKGARGMMRRRDSLR